MKHSLNRIILAAFVLIAGCFSAYCQKTNSTKEQCKSEYNKELKQLVYKSTTVSPSFPEGGSAWARFLNKNLEIPQTVFDDDLRTTTVVTFIVDTGGNLSSFGIKGKEIGKWTAFDSACVNTLKKSVKWTPGMCNNKKVAAYCQQPFIVCLQAE